MQSKTAKINAVERDERAIAISTRAPLKHALEGLKTVILEVLQSRDYGRIEDFIEERLKPLLELQTEIAYLKGGRRAELSAEKVVREASKEYAPVTFSLFDSKGVDAEGVLAYLKKISGINPDKFRTKFRKHLAGAIGDLSREITSEVKKAVIDLTQEGVHLRGGKAKIAGILAKHGVSVANTPALAETLFRTQSMQAYSAGRWNTSTNQDFGDKIWGFEYVTAGDDRVREGHRVLEGVRLPKEDPFWKKYFPPNGWNCRCTTIEIWKDEPTARIDFGITGRDPRKRTADAMNVPAEFRGNVGIFAIKNPKTAPKKPSTVIVPVATKPIPVQMPEAIPETTPEFGTFRYGNSKFPKTQILNELEKMVSFLKKNQSYDGEISVSISIYDIGSIAIRFNYASKFLGVYLQQNTGGLWKRHDDIIVGDTKATMRYIIANVAENKPNVKFKIKTKVDRELDEMRRNVAISQAKKAYRQKPHKFLEIFTSTNNGKEVEKNIQRFISEMEPLTSTIRKDSVKTLEIEMMQSMNIDADVQSREAMASAYAAFNAISEREVEPRVRILKENPSLDAWMCAYSLSKKIELLPDITLKELKETAKDQYKRGWWSSDSPFGSFIHEDTHQQLYFIERVFTEIEITNRFAELIKELGQGKYSIRSINKIRRTGTDKEKRKYLEHELRASKILSGYGSLVGNNGSYYHEMVAEARAEVLTKGKKARDFAKRVYAIYLQLLYEATERKGKNA